MRLNNQNQYTFVVHPKATKNEIKKAIVQAYGVSVLSVNTLQCFGKKVSRYTKKRVIHGKKRDWKKAIVTLPESDMIDIYAENS